jgi:hypothetical protein
MTKRAQLYKTVDFFKLHKVKFVQYIDQPPCALALRYLSAIDDMETINQWRNDPESWSNHIKPINYPYAIKYYYSVLQSTTAQAFIIMAGDHPVCILEIVLAQASSMMDRIPCYPGDGILEYLFKLSIKTNVGLSDVLSLFKNYYFTFEGRGRLILPIRVGDITVIQIAEATGFREMNRAILNEMPYIIYCCP